MNLKVLYKNEYRNILIGNRGGYYFLIDNKKVYISKDKFKDLLKNRVKTKKVNISISKPNIIVSYNLSWATQKDSINGSEIKHVKDCIEKYGKKAVPYKKLSGCTNNLINKLLLFNKTNPLNNIDIICFQEGTIENIKLMFNKINKSKKYDYHVSQISEINILWSIFKKEYGKPIEIFKGDFKNHLGRPIQILYFKNINTLLINAHFPHDVNINELVKLNIYPYVKKYLNNSRIIFCGDFNDSEKQLLKKNAIVLKQLNLRTPKAIDIKSCCYDDDFSQIGDYIFDTNKINYFGILPNFDKVKLASDHKPVILINNKSLIYINN